jgi:hypothetical protein
LIRVLSVADGKTASTITTKRAAFGAMIVQICGVVLVISGVQGRLWPDHQQHATRVRLSEVLDTLESPIIVLGDKYCNLPWIQKRSPHFMYSFTYDVDSAAGMKFERGGIGGLIAESYFRTIVALHGIREFDRQAFDSYEIFEQDAKYSYWRPRAWTSTQGATLSID